MSTEVTPQIIYATDEGHAALLAQANLQYGKEFCNLTYQEACQVTRKAMIEAVRNGFNVTLTDGPDNKKAIVDANLDGAEAALGYLDKIGELMERRVWQEGELVINLLRNRTIWDYIRKRDAKVTPLYRFSTSQPQI